MIKYFILSIPLAFVTCQKSRVEINNATIEREVDGTFQALQSIDQQVIKIQKQSLRQKQNTPLKSQVDRSVPVIKQASSQIKEKQQNIKQLNQQNIEINKKSQDWKGKYQKLNIQFKNYKNNEIDSIFKWCITLSLLGIPVSLTLLWLLKQPRLLIMTGICVLSSIIFGTLFKYFSTFIFGAAICFSIILVIGLIFGIYYLYIHRNAIKDLVKTTDKDILLKDTKESTKKVINKIKV